MSKLQLKSPISCIDTIVVEFDAGFMDFVGKYAIKNVHQVMRTY